MSDTSPGLNARSEAVLKTLIEAYLLDGEPVGSRLLALRMPAAPSPATIRSVLAELELEGWLDQPHTSAGRVPTQKAFRWFVDRWVTHGRPDPGLVDQLSPILTLEDLDPEAWLRQANRTLSEVMGGACIVLPQRLHLSGLARLEFVPLGPARIVAVWVGAGGEVEHQVLSNPWGFTPEQLLELGNFATHRFAGQTLPSLRRRLVESLRDQRQMADVLHQRLSLLASRLEEAVSEGGAGLLVAGLGNLARRREFEEAARFRDLVDAFEEQERLVRLLNAFAEQARESVQVLLGTENPYLPDLPLATALRTIPFGTGCQATFALITPLRADYGRVVGGLAWWTQALSGDRLPSLNPHRPR